MKRMLCLLAALLLAGCAAAPGSSPASSAPAQPDPLVWAGDSANRAGYFSFYYDPAHSQAGTRLARWDFADMAGNLCCTLPDCDHTGQACQARLDGYPLSVLPDAVYTLERDPDEEVYTLIERDTEGLSPRAVGQTGYWNFCGADEAYLYGFCDGAFGRVRRTDGTETYLAHGLEEDFHWYGRVLGVWQDRFVAVNWDIDGLQPARICLLDREGNVTEIARVEAGRFSNYSCALASNAVIYLDVPTGDVMAADLATGETRVLTGALREYNAREEGDFYACQRWVLQAVGDTPVVQVMSLAWEEARQTAFRVDGDGAAAELPQRRELRGYDPALDADAYVYYAAGEQPGPVAVMARWEDELVVLRAFEFFSCEGPDGTFRATRDVYALTDAADYLAGRENYREFAPVS